MKLSDAKNKYLFSTEIDLGDGEFIKLREPSVKDIDGLNRAEDQDRVLALGKLFPLCLVDHSFEQEDGRKSSNEEVYNMLKESSSLFMEIISTWMEAVPFRSRLQKERKSETALT
jgi:hypothetical protein